MALQLSVIKRFPPMKGGIRRMIVEITGDTSYPTGGSAIVASEIKPLQEIYAIVPSLPYPLVDRQYIWDHANKKLMAQVPSTGLQVANGTNCSTDKIRCLVVGR